MLTSWRTTVAGVGAIVAIVGSALKALFDGDPNTNIDWVVSGPALLAAIGLLFARDHVVSSEQAGASTLATKP